MSKPHRIFVYLITTWHYLCAQNMCYWSTAESFLPLHNLQLDNAPVCAYNFCETGRVVRMHSTVLCNSADTKQAENNSTSHSSYDGNSDTVRIPRYMFICCACYVKQMHYRWNLSFVSTLSRRELKCKKADFIINDVHERCIRAQHCTAVQDKHTRGQARLRTMQLHLKCHVSMPGEEFILWQQDLLILSVGMFIYHKTHMILLKLWPTRWL